MGCDEAREKAMERARQPIFTARFDNPEEMQQLKEIFHADALAKTFGPQGGGMREIEEKAAVANLIRSLRKNSQQQSETSSPQ